MDIRLFKTTVNNKLFVDRITPELNTILGQRKWNFDLEDCDRVLRIESTKIPVRKLASLMNKHNKQLTEIL